MAQQTLRNNSAVIRSQTARVKEKLDQPLSGAWRWGLLAAGAAVAIVGIKRRSAAGAGLAVAGGYLATRAAAGKRLNPFAESDRGFAVHSVMTIGRPPEEVYAQWRDFERFPRFMTHLRSVEKLPNGTFRWTAKAPTGAVSWTAELVADENTHVAWRSLPGSMVDNAGVVRFRRAPGDRGTEVDIELEFRPPAGQAGALLARIFGEHPETQVREDLRHFKQLLEAGEVATTLGQSEGPRSLKGRVLKAMTSESGRPQLRRVGGAR